MWPAWELMVSCAWGQARARAWAVEVGEEMSRRPWTRAPGVWRRRWAWSMSWFGARKAWWDQ